MAAKRLQKASLTDKTVVITGAGSGIGRSTALLLAAQGATVFVVDRDGDSAQKVADEITSSSGAAVSVAVDVTDFERMQTLAETVYAATNKVDVLMNNAGIGHTGPIESLEIEDWKKILDVNLMGVVHGVQAFVPKMLAQHGESLIINTSSVIGLVPTALTVPYSTSKAAVLGMSQALHAELSGRGIKVSALCPGVINTNIVANTETSGATNKAIEFYAKRGASPDVVAKDVLKTIHNHKLIVPSPAWQSAPGWYLNRVSPSLSQIISRHSARIITGVKPGE